MLTLTSRAAVDAALADLSLQPCLRSLIIVRAEQLTGDIDNDLDLGDIAHFHVTLPSDTLPDIEAALGMPLKAEQPPWEWVKDHSGWIEAVLVVSDDGFGHVLFVPDIADLDPAILSLFRSQPAAA